MNQLPVQANIKTSPLHDGFNFSARDIKRAITVRAVAYDGQKYSSIRQATYILNDDLCDKNSLPIISLSINPSDLFDHDKGIYVPGRMYKEGKYGTGNYYERGRQTEKPCFIEMFHTDGTPYLSQAIGVRINGGFTRRFPQKSLRLYARSEYGQSKIYPKLFMDRPDEGFKRLVLRNAGDDRYSTMIRDGLMHELVKDRNIDVQAYRPVNVLINGEYWGIHNVREKFTKHYLKKKYHFREKEFAILKIDSHSKDGSFIVDHGDPSDQQDYHQLISFVSRSDLTVDKNLKHVKSKIDIHNFLTYVAIQVYYANTDSFSNNLMVWRKRADHLPDTPYGHDGRWRYLLYDLDWGMGYGLLNIKGDPISFNMLDHVLSKRKEMTLFRQLMTHEQTKKQFIHILMDLLRTNFATDRVQQFINRLTEQIRPAIELSINRWENIDSVKVWEQNIDNLHKFAEKRPKIVRQHLLEKFNIRI